MAIDLMAPQQQNPNGLAGFLAPGGGLSNFLGDNRMALMGLGAGIAGSPTFGGGIAQGLQNAAQFAPYDMQRQQQAEEEQRRNATLKWAASKFPQLAGAPQEIAIPMASALYERALLGQELPDPTTAQQNYEYLLSQGLSSEDALERAFGGSGTNVTVNNNSGTFSEQLAEDFSGNVLDERQAAADAAAMIPVIQEGRAILDSEAGAVTGGLANAKVQVTKLANALGIPVPADAASNSETLKSIMGNVVGTIIKQFGAGTGLSDADRQYAERIAGGDFELTEQSIRDVLDFGERLARTKVQAWEERVPAVMEGDLETLMRVPMPPEYTPPAPSVQEGATATNPQTGEQVVFRGGQWVSVNGQ